MKFSTSRELEKRAKQIIPAGAHTYSKGEDQFPVESPGFIVSGKGSHVFDMDNNEFVDWGMGLRSVILGHAYPRVIDAVQRELVKGSNFTKPSPIEVELAEELIATIPSAEMVKFAKNGSDITTAAVKLARTFTGRDLIAICKEHPFYSVNDWFIGTTPCNTGIPKQVSELTKTFSYNDLDSLKQLFEKYPNSIAAIMLEPTTGEEPKPGFLEGAKAIAHEHGALFIFDEMITGFRWDIGGAQKYFGVTPDLSAFGKAIGNGFSVAVLVGRKDIMELGGLEHDKPRTFLLSTTHGAETHSLAAALATIREFKEHNVIEHIWKLGAKFKQGINELAKEIGLENYISAVGYPCSPIIKFTDTSGATFLELKTLFMQEMIARGILYPGYVTITYSHTEQDLQQTLEASKAAMLICKKAIDGKMTDYLKGRPIKPVFRAYN